MILYFLVIDNHGDLWLAFGRGSNRKFHNRMEGEKEGKVYYLISIF